MLNTVARYYEDDLRERSDALAGLLGPVMLIVMFVVVGFVIAAVMLPIQQIQSMADKSAITNERIRMTHSARPGFTIIEIMIVVMIIGIIAARSIWRYALSAKG